jgi:threonine dehydrogenase-like Zn-dependent dehydrogenase
VVAVGIYPAPVQINLRDLVRQEKNLITSYGYTRSIFEDVLARISKSDSYESLITHTYKLKDGLEAMELAVKRTAGKIILRP